MSGLEVWFTRAYEVYSPQLRAYLSTIANEPFLFSLAIEDIVHDVFTTLWERRNDLDFANDDKLSGWLFATARNRYIDLYRRRKTFGGTVLPVLQFRLVVSQYKASGNELERYANLLKLDFDNLLKQLRQNPDKTVAVVILSKLADEYNPEELANKLGITKKQLKSLVFKARKLARKYLL
jgi:RNA polymerase sigma factor (sigma-70 family)